MFKKRVMKWVQLEMKQVSSLKELGVFMIVRDSVIASQSKFSNFKVPYDVLSIRGKLFN